METAEVIDPGFVVADGEDVNLQMTETGLHLRFTDWGENPVHALFLDAVSHRWEQIEFKELKDERYDSSHIIHNSEWLREHLRQGTIVVGEGYRHYRFNFNACGTLQVLAKGIERHAWSAAISCDADAGH